MSCSFSRLGRTLVNRTDVPYAAAAYRDSEQAQIVFIRNGTFYHRHPSPTDGRKSNHPIASNLSFNLPATFPNFVGKPLRISPHYAIIGANPTPILDILRGQYICDPPNARTYPHLSSDTIARKDPRLRIPSRALQYVGFNSGNGGAETSHGGVRGAYLSARYESRREETDWTLEQYLKGQTELNPAEALTETISADDFSCVVAKLHLGKLLNMPVSNLSNGQTRRSRIAKALLNKPEVLLLDEPFMGLDPPTLTTLSPMLKDLAYRSSPLLILGLRPQDPIPDWITHLAVLDGNNDIALAGSVESVLYAMYNWSEACNGRYHVEADLKAAEAISEVHGSPPFGIASVLTQNGVRPFDAVKNVWEEMKAVKHEGAVPPEHLNSHKRKARHEAIQEQEKDRNPTAWFDLTCDIPASLEEYLAAELRGLSNVRDTEREMNILMSSPADVAGLSNHPNKEPLIELSSIVVKYGEKVVLGHMPLQPGFLEQGLNLTISRGTRLLLLGPNGSGKTTLLSLLTSDHPQSYSLPIRFFGRTRLPEPGKPGLSLWEIQSRIGHSSPEVHAFYPKNQTVRQVLESTWAETFSSKPELTAERSAMVDHFLRVWKAELCQYSSHTKNDDLAWASDRIDHPLFGRLSFGTQRLLLLLRAIIKQPDILILDEAFSGLPTAVQDKALAWLEKGDHSLSRGATDSGVLFPGLTDQQAMVVVSHVREEIPDSVNEYIRLPSEEEAIEQHKTILIGESEPGYIKSPEGWNKIWGYLGRL